MIRAVLSGSVLLAALAGVACASRASEHADSCYSLSLSAYNPPVGADTIYFSPPRNVRLRAEQDIEEQPLESLDRAMTGRGTWRMIAPDSTAMVWTDGTTGVRIHAQLRGDSLHGRATAISDIVVPEAMRSQAAVTGSRIECPERRMSQ